MLFSDGLKEEDTKSSIHDKNCYLRFKAATQAKQRTSDGGNGNHSVSLPIFLIKIKVDQMLPSSYISSLLVSILLFCI